ncbi:hypothetical protein GCM10023084_47170 [Streptomyces lacrimifluminis]|uniref:Ornithine cyclodeaminase n=1 Tax=Streptomyces lacrimifluminis TaxID=1500077 RepID=A0A917P0R3_9ACTN|nr:ornithine cyclodeaminase family protein [Streptomyces lacrimifluminis]GGJ47551.1 hypothetical protein GCM10012282_50630 [Streptomyces lacrimifluminis]
MKPVRFTFLNGSDIAQLELADAEILALAALLNLFDPRTGMPVAVVDATTLTERRTGALTALGERHPARPDARVLGNIGARATSYGNVRLLDRHCDLTEIRVHSRRPESREAFAGRLERNPGKPVVVTEDRQTCVEGADIVVEAARLGHRPHTSRRRPSSAREIRPASSPARPGRTPGRCAGWAAARPGLGARCTPPEPLLRTEWIAPGALIVNYGTNGAVELSLTDIMDKIVVDDWGWAQAGPFGALRARVDSGRLTRSPLHGELGEIVAGRKPGRESPEETNLFRHPGLSLPGIALGAAMPRKAEARGGQKLRIS